MRKTEREYRNSKKKLEGMRKKKKKAGAVNCSGARQRGGRTAVW